MTIYTPFLPDQFCVYHSTYSGDLLPQNYIGSSSVDNVLNKNYHGSVKSARYKDIWKSELKLHPALFSTVIVSYHDTRSNATHKELQVQRIFNVVKSDIFINRAYATTNGFFGVDINLEERSKIVQKTTITKNNKTDEENTSAIQKRLDTIANKTPEQNVVTSKKMSDSKNNKSPEEKAITSKKRSDSRNNRTQEENDASKLKELTTKANRTDEERVITSKKLSDASRSAHATRSLEDKLATKIKTVKTNANKTDEEKAATTLKRANTMSNKTDEEKAASYKKQSDSSKGKLRLPFFSLIETKKTYDKGSLARFFNEFKQWY